MELFWVLLIALVAFSVSYWFGEKLEARREQSVGAIDPQLLERCLYAAEEYLSGRVPEEKLPQESVSLAVKMLELLGKRPVSRDLERLEEFSLRKR